MSKLSKEEKRALEIFSMYLQSYGSKVGRYDVEIQTDGDIYWDYSYWRGDGTNISIDSYDKIEETLKKIFNDNEDILLGNFNSEDRGRVTFILNANDKTLSFKAEVYTIGQNHQGMEYDSGDISQDILDWMSEIGGQYSSGNIHYEGSGD